MWMELIRYSYSHVFVIVPKLPFPSHYNNCKNWTPLAVLLPICACCTLIRLLSWLILDSCLKFHQEFGDLGKGLFIFKEVVSTYGYLRELG